MSGGGWAWYVNPLRDVPDARSPVGSGLIQGAASCLVTLFMLRSVTTLFHVFAPHPARFFLPALLTTALTSSCITLAHVSAGTADVAGTVIPGIVVALGFNSLTCWKLNQQADV